MSKKIQSPLVTVAMVTYNSEKYVRTAIESVLASTYANFELIIADDCSTDATWRIIQSYNDSRIIASKNKVNLREYPNRNKCIELAKGAYFIFIDGDDYIYPHALEHFIKGALLDNNTAMVISRPESDHMIYPVILQPNETFKYDYLGNSITSQGFAATLFKTEILKKHKLPNDYIAGDSYVKKELGYEYPTTLIHDGLIWWRKTPGQASEKLFTTDIGKIENISINTLFLNKYATYLSSVQLDQVYRKLYTPIMRYLVKTLLLLKIANFMNVLKVSRLRFVYVMYLFPHKQEKFKIASPQNPANFIK
jgi:glycosyltransferase involved in cell wall biosynthesis